VTAFSAAWLKLREPVDARSRSEELLAELSARLPRRVLLALDLGSGTGANIRYLAPRLDSAQQWFALDNDPALIKQHNVQFREWGLDCKVSSKQFDLASDLESLRIGECDLVSASALLDLVSASWLQSLAKICASKRAVVMFALNYDGRMECSPPEADDDWVLSLVNRHQRGDKGFGPALGPDATRFACDVFTALDYQWRISASDWLIEPDEQELQRELIAGWLEASREISPSDASRVEQWGLRRNAHLSAGTSRIRVGHQDFIAWPTTRGE
jgi:SAM-dependent methyltransferase